MSPLTPTTELQAVNVMLTSAGESPVNSLDVAGNANISIAQQILREYASELQSRGWHWNTDEEVTLSRDGDSKMPVPANVLQIDTMGDDADVDVVQRGSYLYDRGNRRYTFPDNATLECRVVYFLDFTEMPEAARRLVTIRAARTFQERILGSRELSAFSQDDEAMAMAMLTRAELRTRDYNTLNGSWSVARVLRHRQR